MSRIRRIHGNKAESLKEVEALEKELEKQNRRQTIKGFLIIAGVLLFAAAWFTLVYWINDSMIEGARAYFRSF